MAAYSFAIQMNLYVAMDVIYTVGEDHVWRFSSAFPRTDYEYVCQDCSRGQTTPSYWDGWSPSVTDDPFILGWMVSFSDRRPLHIGMDGVLQ